MIGNNRDIVNLTHSLRFQSLAWKTRSGRARLYIVLTGQKYLMKKFSNHLPEITPKSNRGKQSSIRVGKADEVQSRVCCWTPSLQWTEALAILSTAEQRKMAGQGVLLVKSYTVWGGKVLQSLTLRTEIEAASSRPTCCFAWSVILRNLNGAACFLLRAVSKRIEIQMFS